MHINEETILTDPEIVHGDSEGVHHLSINGFILQVNQIHLLMDLSLQIGKRFIHSQKKNIHSLTRNQYFPPISNKENKQPVTSLTREHANWHHNN